MVWVIPWWGFAIISSVFGTAFALFRKKALQKEHALKFESARGLSIVFFLIFFIPFMKFPGAIEAYLIAFVLAVLAAVAVIFISKAYRHSQISYVYPLQNLKPLFVLIFAYIFLAERVSTKNLIGIAVILLGAYILEADHHFSDLIYPVKALFRSKYSLYFVGAVIVFSVTSILDKYLVTNYFDPLTFLFIVWSMITIILNFVHGIMYGFKEIKQCFMKTKYLPGLVGGLSIFGNIAYLKALQLANISLVAPVVLLSTLGVVLIGGEFFKEDNLTYRIIVSLIMVFGVYLVIT